MATPTSGPPALDLARILGWLFTPLAGLLGIEGADVREAGKILGQRLVLTEVVAYRELAGLAAAGAGTPPRRTLIPGASRSACAPRAGTARPPT